MHPVKTEENRNATETKYSVKVRLCFTQFNKWNLNFSSGEFFKPWTQWLNKAHGVNGFKPSKMPILSCIFLSKSRHKKARNVDLF